MALASGELEKIAGGKHRLFYWIGRSLVSKRTWSTFGVKMKWLHQGLLTGGPEDLPYCPDAKERRAFFCPSVAYGWITPLPPEIPVGTVELDEP